MENGWDVGGGLNIFLCFKIHRMINTRRKEKRKEGHEEKAKETQAITNIVHEYEIDLGKGPLKD